MSDLSVNNIKIFVLSQQPTHSFYNNKNHNMVKAYPVKTIRTFTEKNTEGM